METAAQSKHTRANTRNGIEAISPKSRSGMVPNRRNSKGGRDAILLSSCEAWNKVHCHDKPRSKMTTISH